MLSLDFEYAKRIPSLLLFLLYFFVEILQRSNLFGILYVKSFGYNRVKFLISTVFVIIYLTDSSKIRYTYDVSPYRIQWFISHRHQTECKEI
jgi:uncharacterized membrane protein